MEWTLDAWLSGTKEMVSQNGCMGPQAREWVFKQVRVFGPEHGHVDAGWQADLKNGVIKSRCEPRGTRGETNFIVF